MNSPETLAMFNERLKKLNALTGATYTEQELTRCLGGWVLVVDRRHEDAMNVSVYPPEISARLVLHTV